MTKSIVIRLQDDAGVVYRWTISRVARAWNCGIGIKSHYVSGWQFSDHDGYVRFAEGNWLDLVAHVKLVASNYGFSLMSELS